MSVIYHGKAVMLWILLWISLIGFLHLSRFLFCCLFWLLILEGELRQRVTNGLSRRIKEAKFPIKKYLVDFDRNKYDECFIPKFTELETIDFVGNKENIILIGTPGAGKTHYAIALGIAACMKGHSVLFASVPNLIVDIKEAVSNNQMSAFRKRFEKYNLAILDELGYVSMDKSGSERV
jgi:DNA replication protein DnaC